MQQIGADQRQVFDPHQHVHVQGPPGLNLHAVKVHQHVGLGGLVLVVEDVLTPPVRVGPGQISLGDLLQDMSHM